MSILRELLREDSPVSSTRAMSFISLFCGVGVAIYGLSSGKDPVSLAALCSVFVGAAFGAKITQKFIENKSTQD